jgi:DNA (cytosine-5)-methyltransferase 1
MTQRKTSGTDGASPLEEVDDAGSPAYLSRGTDSPWYRGWAITTEERAAYREMSKASARAKRLARDAEPLHPLYKPRLNNDALMPRLPSNGLRALSLFSGGGGLDIGFDHAGFEHVASYEILDFAAQTLQSNRPSWAVMGGARGDVTGVDWRPYCGRVDVIHGGPPCQPFSTAGRRNGEVDPRDMFPEFVRAVLAVEPRAFIAENVPGLQTAKFRQYIGQVILEPLARLYRVEVFDLAASDFGVPQKRRRVVFFGTKIGETAASPAPPPATHRIAGNDCDGPGGQGGLFGSNQALPVTMGAREALGLPDIGVDGLAPTLRCALTGPRHTTSVLSSVSALREWGRLQIWPNGVSRDRELARRYPTKHGHFRLSVDDCALIQGFPASWRFTGPTYKALGQIGNSVAPPMAYNIALAVAKALR